MDRLEAPAGGWPGRLVAVGDLKVFVRHAGDAGDPVLCVHGLEGSSLNWTDLMAELASTGEFTLDAMDLPGFGHRPGRGRRGDHREALRRPGPPGG
jgi:pimeloyl-ACP methyl ester carboxylesterase